MIYADLALGDYDADINALVRIEDMIRAAIATAKAGKGTVHSFAARDALDDLANVLTDALGDTTSPAISDLAISAARLDQMLYGRPV